jgi:hypothetical protein
MGGLLPNAEFSPKLKCKFPGTPYRSGDWGRRGVISRRDCNEISENGAARFGAGGVRCAFCIGAIEFRFYEWFVRSNIIAQRLVGDALSRCKWQRSA